MLHGKGHDRWFDKSFTLIVASNGRVSFKLSCVRCKWNLTILTYDIVIKCLFKSHNQQHHIYQV